jgi:hypothetical protein
MLRWFYTVCLVGCNFNNSLIPWLSLKFVVLGCEVLLISSYLTLLSGMFSYKIEKFLLKLKPWKPWKPWLRQFTDFRSGGARRSWILSTPPILFLFCWEGSRSVTCVCFHSSHGFCRHVRKIIFLPSFTMKVN